MKRVVSTDKGNILINGWTDHELWRYQTANGWLFLKIHKSYKKKTKIYYAWDWIGNSDKPAWEEKGWAVYLLSKGQVKKYVEWLNKEHLLNQWQKKNAIRFGLLDEPDTTWNEEEFENNNESATILYNKIINEIIQNNKGKISHIKEVKM